MSERLEARAEVVKLARLLSVDEAQLAFLDELPPAELRTFREAATDRLFDAGAQAFGRVGAAARIVPSGLAATIAHRAFGPLLCARAAGAVEPDKAIDVARRLPAEFLAEVTIELDPRRVARIIGGVPASLVEPVAAELGRRGEHVTMGRFLAFVPDHAVAAAIGALDDEALLRTAFVLEHKDRLDHALGLLPAERVPDVLRSASRLGIWPEALDLLDHLSDDRRGPIADVVAELDEPVVAELVAAVHAAGLWDGLLPVVRTMSPDARVKLARRAPFHDPAVLTDIMRAAAEQDLWRDLVPLVDALPPEVLHIVASAAADLEPELLAQVAASAAGAPETIPTLLTLVAEMSPDVRDRVIERLDVDGLVAQQPEDEVAALVAAVSARGLWHALLPIVQAIGEDGRNRLAAMPAFHDRAVLAEIIALAAGEGLWRELVPLVAAVPEAVRLTVAQVATELEPALLGNVLAEAALDPVALSTLLLVVEDMTPEGRTTVVTLIDDADKRLADDIVAALADETHARTLLEGLPPEIGAAIRRAASRHGHDAVLDRLLG